MNKCANVRKFYPVTLNFFYAFIIQKSVYPILYRLRDRIIIPSTSKTKKSKTISIRYTLDNEPEFRLCSITTTLTI